MLIVNRTEKNITGAINGKPFSVPFNETVYKKLQGFVTELETERDLTKVMEIYDEAKKLTTLDFKAVIAAATPYLMYNPVLDKYFLVINRGKPTEKVDDRPLPGKLARMIVESYEKGFDYMPLVKAWARFLQRDKEYSKEDAKYFATYLSAKYYDTTAMAEAMEKEGISEEAAKERFEFNDLAITKEGLLATYKVVEEVTEEHALELDEAGKVALHPDGKPKTKLVLKKGYEKQYQIDPFTGEVKVTDGKPQFVEDRMFTPAIHKYGENFYSGSDYGYIYQVGKAQFLPKTNPKTGNPSVINYDNTFGGGGLYTGGLQYIHNYRRPETPVLVCFLDPANIISFQNDGAAIRTWEIFPHNILEDEAELKGIYHSSEYAKESAEKTKARIEEIINKRKEELAKKEGDHNALTQV